MRLDGVTVLLTRPECRDKALAGRLEEAGARVLLAPAIRFEAVAAALPAGPFDWLALTSPNVAELLPDGVTATRTAALGDGTKRALEARGIDVDLVSSEKTGAGLARALLDAGAAPGTRVLHPTSDRPRPELRETLEAAGVEVVTVTVYRTLPAPMPEAVRREIEDGAVAAIVLYSPSAVEALLENLSSPAATRLRSTVLAAAIGPTTGAALGAAGFARIATATEPTTDAVVAVLTGRLGKDTP